MFVISPLGLFYIYRGCSSPFLTNKMYIIIYLQRCNGIVWLTNERKKPIRFRRSKTPHSPAHLETAHCTQDLHSPSSNSLHQCHNWIIITVRAIAVFHLQWFNPDISLSFIRFINFSSHICFPTTTVNMQRRRIYQKKQCQRGLSDKSLCCSLKS